MSILPSVIAPFLPILWVLVATAYWWRQLSSPVLFIVAALLGLFGLQAIITFAWDWWPHMTGGYFLEVSKPPTAEEIEQRLASQNQRAIIQGAIVLAAGAPFLWWLKSGLTKLG